MAITLVALEGQPQAVHGQVGLALGDRAAAVDHQRREATRGDDDRSGAELRDHLGGDAAHQPVDEPGETEDEA